MEAFLAQPSEASKRALDEQSQLVNAVEANLVTARLKAAAPGPAPVAACTRTVSYGADVRFFHCLDVAEASASYSTSNAVAWPEQCTVHSYSYVSNTCGGVLNALTDTRTQTGTNVSCHTWVQGDNKVGCYD